MLSVCAGALTRARAPASSSCAHAGNVGANGIHIITVREWGEETSGAPIAPLRRERVIGDMWKYTNYGRCAAAVYRTCMRDTSVFDMGSGRGVFTMVCAQRAHPALF